MGFSYPAWAGVFYPRSVRPGDYLTYYSRCFDCVELDTTFYGLPEPQRVRRWAAAVPDDFRFAVKTPRDITHADDVAGQHRLMRRWTDTLLELGPKLGVVLLQFPPSFDAQRWRELVGLLRTVPASVPLCVEFRHPSWWRWASTPTLLAEHDVAWASADYVASPRELRVVGRRAYVRLIGEHDRYPDMNRELRDPTAELVWWHQQVQAQAHALDEAWVLLNNDYAGFSIATAERFKRLLGLSVLRPGTTEPSLFGTPELFG